MNYAPLTPRDKGGSPKENYPPAKISLASSTDENASVSSVISFTHNTTEIEVAAVGQGIAGRWAGNQAVSVVTASGTANFDFIVPSGEARRYVVPVSVFSGSYASVQGVNRAEGLYQNIAYKTLAGNGSVLTAEF